MTRPRSIPAASIGLVLAVALFLAIGAPVSGDRSANAASTSVLGVAQVEYRLALSSGTVRAGRLEIDAVDRGRDPHDLRLRALAGGHETAAPQLLPGQRWSGVVRLAPGTYELWCSLPEHARLGMRTTLRVVR